MTRNGSVCGGDAVGNNAFGPTGEWTICAQDTYSYLGSHTTQCQVVPSEVHNWGSMKGLYR